MRVSMIRKKFIVAFLFLAFSGFSLESCMGGDYSLKIAGPDPRDTTVAWGGVATFRALGLCGEPCGSFNYQWKKNGVVLSDGKTSWGSTISGSSSVSSDGSRFEIDNVQSADEGYYTCLLTSAVGDSLLLSRASLLRVKKP